VIAAGGRARRAATVAAAAHPYLVIEVAAQPFALPLEAVERVVRLSAIEPLPEAPPALHGLLESEGAAIGVLDLAPLFGRPAAVPSAESCVLVISGSLFDGVLRGLLAPVPPRVVELTAIAPAPRAGGLFAAEWIAGMAPSEGGFLPVLDLGRLLASAPARAALATAAKARRARPV
jgi:purine-binding chemotaxis protein CheW